MGYRRYEEATVGAEVYGSKRELLVWLNGQGGWWDALPPGTRVRVWGGTKSTLVQKMVRGEWKGQWRLVTAGEIGAAKKRARAQGEKAPRQSTPVEDAGAGKTALGDWIKS